MQSLKPPAIIKVDAIDDVLEVGVIEAPIRLILSLEKLKDRL